MNIDKDADQDDLLRRHLRYLAERSPWYSRVFTERGLNPEEIRTTADLAELPFTTKADLELAGDQFLCVSPEDIVDICLTSGTTGRPVVVPQTKDDLERLGYNEESAFRSAGVTSGDRALIACASDRCFMAGLAYFLGITRLGATAIRGGSGSVPVLAELVRRLRPTVIVGVPSFLATVADRLRQDGDDPASMGVEKMVCIGEPVRSADLSLSALGERISSLWGAKIFGTYASTETATTFCDCTQGRGGHLQPDLMVLEIVDEEGRPVTPGQPGEVVATPLQVTGMPLLRFRTGDVAALHDGPCDCGRNTPRLGPILGRKAHMLKYRGTTVYPQAIFDAVRELDWAKGCYIEVYDEYDLSDRIRVVVGASDARAAASDAAEKIAARTRVKPEVALASPEEVLQRTVTTEKRKPVTLFDFRKNRRIGEL